MKRAVGTLCLTTLVALGGCSFTGQSGSDAPQSSISRPAAAIAANTAMDFVTIFDTTADLPEADRLVAVRNALIARFPEFYGPSRYNSAAGLARRDQRIAAAIKGFPALRERYLAKAAGFEAQLTANIATFRTVFPAFEPSTPIALVHSLGEMDGGTRTLGDQTWLIFGVDGMVNYHPYENEAAFFHHELFHTYHQAVSPVHDCADVACNLWIEGLAVYAASRLNPGASDAELLLTLPPDLVSGTRAELSRAFAHLQGVLDSEDEAVISALFSFGADDTGLPRRRGYYLGKLVAEELGKTRSLDELARLSRGDVRPLIGAAVERLAAVP